MTYGSATLPSERNVDFISGLRGLAALWVFVGHAQILLGWRLPLIGQPDLAVDLFMMISGFLMVHQALQKQSLEPVGQVKSWLRFWVRRFFRIAPVYYLCLIAALLMGPILAEQRGLIDHLVPAAATPQERYTDQSIENILMHVSFLFGFSSSYHLRTALPDWSIGLEMQFLSVFPGADAAVAQGGAGIVRCYCCRRRWHLQHAFP